MNEYSYLHKAITALSASKAVALNKAAIFGLAHHRYIGGPLL